MKSFLTSLPGSIATVALIALVVLHGWPLSAGANGDIRIFMSVLISFVVLGCGLYIVLSKRYKPETEKWAYGALGTVIGFWLNTGT